MRILLFSMLLLLAGCGEAAPTSTPAPQIIDWDPICNPYQATPLVLEGELPIYDPVVQQARVAANLWLDSRPDFVPGVIVEARVEGNIPRPPGAGPGIERENHLVFLEARKLDGEVYQRRYKAVEEITSELDDARYFLGVGLSLLVDMSTRSVEVRIDHDSTSVCRALNLPEGTLGITHERLSSNLPPRDRYPEWHHWYRIYLECRERYPERTEVECFWP